MVLFSIFLRGDLSTFALFDIELNDEILCTVTVDNDSDSAQTTCSSVFYASQGNLKTRQASVILATGGGCLPQCMLGYQADPPAPDTPPRDRTPPGPDTPRDQTHPLGPYSPQEQTPPPAHTPLRDQTPCREPPWEADSGIRSTSGRYACYWNAFLLSAKNI